MADTRFAAITFNVEDAAMEIDTAPTTAGDGARSYRVYADVSVTYELDGGVHTDGRRVPGSVYRDVEKQWWIAMTGTFFGLPVPAMRADAETAARLDAHDAAHGAGR